jgi:hypothetical protein
MNRHIKQVPGLENKHLKTMTSCFGLDLVNHLDNNIGLKNSKDGGLIGDCWGLPIRHATRLSLRCKIMAERNCEESKWDWIRFDWTELTIWKNLPFYPKHKSRLLLQHNTLHRVGCCRFIYLWLHDDWAITSPLRRYDKRTRASHLDNCHHLNVTLVTVRLAANRLISSRGEHFNLA